MYVSNMESGSPQNTTTFEWWYELFHHASVDDIQYKWSAPEEMIKEALCDDNPVRGTRHERLCACVIAVDTICRGFTLSQRSRCFFVSQILRLTSSTRNGSCDVSTVCPSLLPTEGSLEKAAFVDDVESVRDTLQEMVMNQEDSVLFLCRLGLSWIRHIFPLVSDTLTTVEWTYSQRRLRTVFLQLCVSEFLDALKTHQDHHGRRLVQAFIDAWYNDRHCHGNGIPWYGELGKHDNHMCCCVTHAPLLIPLRVTNKTTQKVEVVDAFWLSQAPDTTEQAFMFEHATIDWDAWRTHIRPRFVEKKEYLQYCAWVHGIDADNFLTFLREGFGISSDADQQNDPDEFTCITYPWKWACRIRREPLSSMDLDKDLYVIAQRQGYRVDHTEEQQATNYALRHLAIKES